MTTESVDFLEYIENRFSELNGASPEEWQKSMTITSRFPEWDLPADIKLSYTIPQIDWEYTEGHDMTENAYYDRHKELNSQLHSACQSAFQLVLSNNLEEMKKQGVNLNYQISYSPSFDLIRNTTPPQTKFLQEKNS